MCTKLLEIAHVQGYGNDHIYVYDVDLTHMMYLLQTYRDYIKVVNIIQEACDDCKEAAMAAHVGRRR
jgi:hypothetical protein